MLNFDPTLQQIDGYQSLFIQNTPLLDVRAPVEFREGAFPNTVNHPLVNDDERHQIGLTYKNQGQSAAIELGLKLVSGKTKQQRITSWQQFAQQNPQGALYCFRGGLRSRIVQQWLYEHAGIYYPRIKGGYKKLRSYLIEQLGLNALKMRPVILGGQTGVGKTRVLKNLAPHLDLEKLAWHRGSAFGNHATPQPTQIDFENRLSIALLKQVYTNSPYFVIEDESRNIGGRHIPQSFFTPFSQAPIVVLEASLEERIDITLQEYVHDALAEYRNTAPPSGSFKQWSDYLRNSLSRIERRLGHQKYIKIRNSLDMALSQHQAHGNIQPHRKWIKQLLTDYYDSMYTYQLNQKKHRIIFSGKKSSVIEYLAETFDIK